MFLMGRFELRNEDHLYRARYIISSVCAHSEHDLYSFGDALIYCIKVGTNLKNLIFEKKSIFFKFLYLGTLSIIF